MGTAVRVFGALVATTMLVGAAAETKAGVAKVAIDPPIGVPLAGFSARQWAHWPLPKLKSPDDLYTTWMQPSVGVRDMVFSRALMIEDAAGKTICHVTMDGIGSDGGLNAKAFAKATAAGFPLPRENVIFHATHSHSSFGAVSDEFLWEIAPAIDLLVPEVAEHVAQRVADSMMEAHKAMQPAVLGMGMSKLYNVTRNRRAHLSPYLQPDDIDPNVGLMRVDTLAGEPLATVWNFAIHGTCLGSSNLNISGDIMGAATNAVEAEVGAVALFINADAGDIAPVCGDDLSSHTTIAKAVVAGRHALVPTADVSFDLASMVVEFGPTNMNLTLDRVGMCKSDSANPAAVHAQEGEIDLCSIFKHLDVNAHLGSNWLENKPRFTALTTRVGKERFMAVTLPGEPLTTLGKMVREDAAALGYDTTMLFGYSNNHMGYFADPVEYQVGGYESLLTFWGIDTAQRIRTACRDVMSAVARVASA